MLPKKAGIIKMGFSQLNIQGMGKGRFRLSILTMIRTEF
jgi:hypothetical protein